jgi:hypothetical protein
MRRFAWLCVVIGILIAVAWPLYLVPARERARARAAAVVERMKTDGPGVPGGPWEIERKALIREWQDLQALSMPAGVATGAAAAGFGILLLAIRRPRE